MRVFHKFSTAHDDLVHDVSYDFYGKRLATCSSDQKIKVWDLDDSGKWTLSGDWKAHSGSIWKVAWAHPEFGQVIASCSFDRTVCIWEECEDEKGQKKWVLKAPLVDSRDSVVDIKFAPKEFGLRLATCSLDGYVRIYEAMDIMNLAQWSIFKEFESQKGSQSNCISWNQNPYDNPMIAIGSIDSFIKIWEYNDATRKWLQIETININQSSSNGTLGISNTGIGGSLTNSNNNNISVNSNSNNNNNNINNLNSGNKQTGEFTDPNESAKMIHDISWAPNMGRSYHLIATAGKDHTVRIFKLSPSQQDKSKLELKEIMSKSDHKSEVWRVEWNITGTILASSGDDGNVLLWKCNTNGEWKLLSKVSNNNE